MKKTKIATLLVPLTIAGGGIATPAFAEGGFTLEEVVVTARKREESLQDVPVAVSNFSADDMKALNITQTSDVAAFTPSVHIEQPGANAGTIAKVTIRGQVQSDNLITLDQSVGWYLDDIYLSRPQGTSTSMFDIDRVEVLKGPQGTLYGRNTTGGTIKLVTTKADPTEGITGYVIGGVGNYEQSKIGGGINIPLVEDTLAIRLTVLQDKVDEGFQDVTVYDGDVFSPTVGTVIGRQKNGTKDNEMYRIGVTWLPTDKLSVMLGYEHNETSLTMVNGNFDDPGALLTGNVLGAFPFIPNTDFYDININAGTGTGPINYAESETDTYSLTIQYDLTDNISSKFVYGHRELESLFNTDVDGTNQPFSVFIEPFTNEGEQDSVEWQLSGTAMDGAMDWVTGVYWFEETGQDLSVSGGFSQTFGGVHYSLSKAEVDKNESKSVFFQSTLHLTDSVNFTGGIRYTKDSKPVKVTSIQVRPFGTGEFCRFGDATSGVPNVDVTNCTWSNEEDYEFISWTAGFDWTINDDVMAYLKGSSASRSGGQNLRGLDAVTTQPFAPEKATDIELGIKGQFFDNSLQLNAAYYHTFYTDIQQSNLTQTPSGLITVVVNQAEADIDGIELEAKWVITDQLQLSATAGLLDWNFADSTSILPAAPTEEFTLRANYLIPTDYGQWLFDLNWVYRGEYPGNCAGQASAGISPRDCVRDFERSTGEAIDLLGARVGVDIDSLGLNVALWGRNLTDEKYISPGLELYFPVNGITATNDVVGSPRTYGLEVTYSF